MKTSFRYLYLIVFLLVSFFITAQHQSKLVVEYNNDAKTITVSQELIYYNQSSDTLKSIILNDWNNAYSDKNTPLGKRFSDEFVRSFHIATSKERGNTTINSIVDASNNAMDWKRPENHPDLVDLQLNNALLPNQKTTINLSYTLKIPNNKFTKYGYNLLDEVAIKNWFLTPSRYENGAFIQYSNLNLDDVVNALTDIDLSVIVPPEFNVNSDLVFQNLTTSTSNYSGKKIMNSSLFIAKKNTFSSFKNATLDVTTNLQENKISDIQKAIIIDKIVSYVTTNLGEYNLPKIVVSQTDYEQNPFYGLNQLPSFIRPFQDDYVFELKFLKTFLNNYLKNTLQLDSRKDNWIFDAIQVYYMMKYMDEFYPDAKMMGSIAKLKLVKSYNLVTLDFNEQYSYYYMLMARKNLDQPVGDSKNTFIKFNEKIASKYKAGLSFKYLASYIGEDNLNNSIIDFVAYASKNETNAAKFESIVKSKSTKNIDWFFTKIVNSRDIIDYKFNTFSKTKDSISFSLKNKTDVLVPIAVYGIKNKKIVFKKWIDEVKKDSIYKFERFNADKIVINYQNEVPEFNRRNNWKSLKSFKISNKPIKFNFLKDLEDPNYNQILYVPTLGYNLYDGFIPGMSFHNKTLLDKPFTFDIIPSYSLKSNSLSGSFSFVVNQYNRNSNLFNIRYGFSGNTFRYAQDANYQKVNPYVIFRFRENDYRDNHKRNLLMRQVYVNREKSQIVKNTFEGNYSVFNARYSNYTTEITKTFGYSTDLQLSSNFGKIAGDFNFRRLFNDNRQVNLRLYAGYFLYNNSNSDYFNFALDRPTDYLFDYNYLGRSESTGIFSQQYIIAEGGFKSKLKNASASQFITTANGSFNVWNWIEIYGDVGIIKSKNTKEFFAYDSGIRLNLVTDYFELYFPVYSNNGWEIAQPNYSEKIRFIVAFSPNTLISLFTRKWF
ncbi:aminopeptidase [Flavobacterium sp.]|uniref:aminopeptidase n=1 Tax=Flavobacterium sp. TaxID=239 RepID=UPI003752507F